jgi:RimJ/RimL family protein N-acetyltransferase
LVKPKGVKVQLSDERIKLFPLGESDLQFCLEILTCSELMAHVSTPLTNEEAKSVFDIRSQPWDKNSDKWLALVITDIELGKKAGWVSLRILDHDTKTAEIGFILKSSFHGKSIVSDALKILKEYAYNDLGLNKLVAICSVHNTPSYKVLEKAGFIREGCLMQNALISNQYVDTFAYGLCKSAL